MRLPDTLDLIRKGSDRTETDARCILSYLVRVGLVTFSGNTGYHAQHGKVWEADVLARALPLASANCAKAPCNAHR